MVAIGKKKKSSRKGRVKFSSNISLPRQSKKTNDSTSLVLPSPLTITWAKTLRTTKICFIAGSMSAQ